MKTIAFIPARYAATRFPGKLMQMLGDKTIIRHTYENTKATLLFDEVIVATDSEIIFNEIIHYGGYAIMSKQPHESGSDRIAEAVADGRKGGRAGTGRWRGADGAVAALRACSISPHGGHGKTTWPGGDIERLSGGLMAAVIIGAP